MAHISVLKDEVIKYLDPRPGERFVDGTCGGGGHTHEILRNITPGGRILCLDLDKETIGRLEKKFERERAEGRMTFVNDNFFNLGEIIKKNGFSPVNGILLDLGMSSDQLEGSGRGFSFLKDEALDMRYWTGGNLTAREIINLWSEAEIEKILKDYGEEPFARRVAQEILRARKTKPITTTNELVGIIALAIPKKYQHGRTNFATRTFQALRIAVNDELASLEKVLPQAVDLLDTGGRLVIISFHSLEDRIVKKFFRLKAQNQEVQILTKKPVRAAEQELVDNPRSRSAKLRAIKKI